MKKMILIITAISMIVLCFASCSSLKESPTLPQGDQSNSQELLGAYTIEFNIDTLTANVTANREMMANYNVTGWLGFPSIQINSYDPVAQVVDVDATITNSFALNGYDLRLIVFTDVYGHMLLNSDNWTLHWDPYGGMYINPFKAYAKTETNRIFASSAVHTENLLISTPNNNFSVQVAIEAHYPGNCPEPYEISNFIQLWDLGTGLGSIADIELTVRDWQNDLNSINLSCPEITGTDWVPFFNVGYQQYLLHLENATAAPAGEYEGWLMGISGGEHLYDRVKITVAD